MDVSEDQISSFQLLYEREYGQKLDDEMARELASNLLGLYRAVYTKNVSPQSGKKLDISRGNSKI